MKTETFTFRLSQPERLALQRIAATNRMSESRLVRQCLKSFIDTPEAVKRSHYDEIFA
jgi:predicted transcriptional regulator